MNYFRFKQVNVKYLYNVVINTVLFKTSKKVKSLKRILIRNPWIAKGEKIMLMFQEFFKLRTSQE